MSSPPDPAARFRLPDSFASVGDPIDGNPFPVDDPLHTVWIESTRKAEAEVCHLTSSVLMNLAPGTAQDWPATLVVIKFDAWARRGASVVWSDRAVPHYDQWLVSYANACLDEVARWDTSAPPPSAVEASLVDLRNRLGAQVHVWKGFARRVCAEHQAARASHPRLPADAASVRVFDMFSGGNPFPEHDPGHHQWIDRGRSLAADLMRIDSVFWSARPTAADTTTLVTSLARWTTAYFETMAKGRLVIVVHDKSEAALEAYRVALDALYVQALKVADVLQTRVSGHVQTLVVAFPGATVSNAVGAAFVADVHQRLMPEVTRQLARRKAQRWLQACTIVHVDDVPCADDAETAPEPAGAVEAVSDEGTAPQTDSPASVPEADQTGSWRATSGGAAPVLPAGPAPVAPPTHDPMVARRWEDVEIRFVSEFTFQAVVNGTVQPPRNYAEVGFGDGRHGRPKAAWETLRALAESGGVITSTRTAAAWPKLEKRIQEIRKLLRVGFALEGDPVPYVKGGYRTRFTIRVSASYER